MKTLCDYCKNGNRETKQCYLGGMDICKGELFEAQLQQATVSPVCKLCQKQIIAEIMHDDEQSGIYE